MYSFVTVGKKRVSVVRYSVLQAIRLLLQSPNYYSNLEISIPIILCNLR